MSLVQIERPANDETSLREPLTAAADASDAQDARNDEMAKLAEAVVMVVDDEPINIEVTQVHLEEAGYTKFVSTSEPLEAVPLMVERRPDVLLLDLNMPGRSG